MVKMIPFWLFLNSLTGPKIYTGQESPPVWTQEAYRPLRSNYSICCPIPGGTPSLARGLPPPGEPAPGT